MIDFFTLQGLTIPEGVVTQITDASGRVLWSVGKPVVLQVAKQTLTTYAGETSYADESFILLNIYPKTKNSKVNVTYGGLTKTLQFSGSNAQQVYFGTFNGITDSIATPTSGTLTIEGSYSNFACGDYIPNNKGITSYCSCITDVSDWGDITHINPNAFNGCTNLAITSLPNNITDIGIGAFIGCTSIAFTMLPESVKYIGGAAFSGCTNLALTKLPSGLTSIAQSTFNGCTNLALTSLPSSITSIGDSAFYYCEKVNITKFHEGLVSIGARAFCMQRDTAEYTDMYGSTITLPSTLQSIGDGAFRTDQKDDAGSNYLGYLAGVKILATTPPTLENYDAFPVRGDFWSTFKITVPKGCGDAYNTAPVWSNFATRIVEAS